MIGKPSGLWVKSQQRSLVPDRDIAKESDLRDHAAVGEIGAGLLSSACALHPLQPMTLRGRKRLRRPLIGTIQLLGQQADRPGHRYARRAVVNQTVDYGASGANQHAAARGKLILRVYEARQGRHV